MRDAVEPCPALVVGTNDIPGRMFRAGRLQHQVPRLRIVVPSPVGFRIHRAQLPLTERIVDSRLEPALLLVHSDLEPELDKDDATCDDIFLHLWTERKESLVLRRRTEAHHIFDAGAVVPAAVEDDDFTCSRKMLHVALKK